MADNERLVAAIRAWQTAPNVHPLTCGVDSRHALLVPEIDLDARVRLRCPTCSYQQTVTGTSLESIVANGPPPAPDWPWIQDEPPADSTAAALPEIRVEEIRARLNAADWGPWKVYVTVLEKNEAGLREFPADFEMREYRIGTADDHPQLKGPVPIVTTCSRAYCVEPHGVSISPANAEFIANAPEDIRDLLADRDRLLERVEELERDGDDLFEERGRLREALFFFALVIRSGEPWTEHCDAALGRATAPLGSHRAALTSETPHAK